MEILRLQLIKVQNMLAKFNPIPPQQEEKIQKENTRCNDICLTLIASKLILLRGRSGLTVTWVAKRKVAGRRNSLPTLCRLVAGGSAPIARYPWVRGRPQIASGLCTKIWRRPSKRLLNFGDGIKDPCILLICQESQEESLKLLSGAWIFSPRVFAMMS